MGRDPDTFSPLRPESPENAAEGTALDWPRHAGVAAGVMAEVAAHVNRRRRRQRAAVAALGLLLLGAGWFWPRSPELPLATPAAPALALSLPERRSLPDGSIVDLKEGAEITVEYAGTRRHVRLRRGEAHFQVKPDPARPFVVSAQNLEVRAVGTAFAVHWDQTAIEVLVTEGRVAVDHPTAPEQGAPRAPVAAPLRTLAVVEAGNRVRVPVAGDHREVPPPEVQALSAAELDDRLAWRIPRIEFSGMPLSEALPIFNRYSATPLVLADPVLGSLQLSGILRADNTEALLRLLETNFHIAAEFSSASEIVLRRSAP